MASEEDTKSSGGISLSGTLFIILFLAMFLFAIVYGIRHGGMRIGRGYRGGGGRGGVTFRL